MILKLDPRWPVVWRTPHSAQVGIDSPKAVLDDLTVTQEHMLSALVLGISRPGFELLRESAPGERARFVNALAPALLGAETSAPAPVVAISGSGPFATTLADLLARSGIRVLLASDDRSLRQETPSLAVLVGRWVLAPDIHSHWLRRDVPHLPIVFGDTGVTIGPLVEPGNGPCLRCIELHRTDADTAWPAIASQLTGLRGTRETVILAAEAAAIAFRLISAGQATGAESIHVDADTGDRTTTHWERHPRCGCGGIEQLLS